MSSCEDKPIQHKFALELLTFNFALSPALGKLDTALSSLAESETKQRLKLAIGEVFFALGWKFPEAIFPYHSDLRAMFDDLNAAELALVVEKNQQALESDESEGYDSDDIQPELAKHLLAILYALDKPLDLIWDIEKEMVACPQKELLQQALGEIMFVTLGDLMVPIYRRQPNLGRASEPGSWLAEMQQAAADHQT